ncbi:MarR family winged helix-turn-helix transcriptional regulator [Tabrizicola sp.]|uniref:MarR family winged helix-turn-helix transcriptional regulator n=1 Tax=Tabrizicola sp. TaxID=2005166 RepID=UPI003F3D021D
MEGKGFDLQDFLPYLLNQAAEATSRGFERVYKTSYGMTRTQWRVLANLGRFGAMTARDICRISHIEKTKVSRAVAALEAEGMLARAPSSEDGRAEVLSLTSRGREVFADLGQRALAFDFELRARLGPEVAQTIDAILREISALHVGVGREPEDR